MFLREKYTDLGIVKHAMRDKVKEYKRYFTNSIEAPFVTLGTSFDY